MAAKATKRKFKSVLVMTFQKRAFGQDLGWVEKLRKEFVDEGIKLVLIRHNNNSASPRFELFRVE